MGCLLEVMMEKALRDLRKEGKESLLKGREGNRSQSEKKTVWQRRGSEERKSNGGKTMSAAHHTESAERSQVCF